MKRILATSILLALASVCAAAPSLVTAPYPSAAVQPTAASLSVNGGSAQACTLKAATDGSVQPVCDLAGITSPGAYTLVVTVTNPGGCTSGTNTATCTSGGSASSDPFTFNLRAGSVGKPLLSVTP